MSDYEDNLIIEQANLYLSGKSFREIAKIYNVSHVTISNNLTKRLKDSNLSLYNDVMNKIDLSKEIDKDRVLTAYHLLVDEGKTVLEIVDEINKKSSSDKQVTEFIIYRDLTRRMPRLCETNPEEVTLKMVEDVKTILNKHRLDNLEKKKDKEEKNENAYKYLLIMYPNKESRWTVLKHIALTFGLRLEALSDVMGLDIETLKNYLKYNSDSAIMFLFSHGFVNQEKAKENFWQYFNMLLKAWKEQDKEKLKSLLDVISDKKVIQLKKERKRYEKLTDEDIDTILRYQLKYGLATTTVCNYFGLGQNNYIRRVYAYVEDKPTLRSDYEYIADYYLKSWRNR